MGYKTEKGVYCMIGAGEGPQGTFNDRASAVAGTGQPAAPTANPAAPGTGNINNKKVPPAQAKAAAVNARKQLWTTHEQLIGLLNGILLALLEK